MSKFITTHRRGTIGQWQLSTIIPKDGEIVVAEGTYKTVDPDSQERINKKYYSLKVGNGVNLWKDLPEADAKTRDEIAALDLKVNKVIKELTDQGAGQEDPASIEVVSARLSGVSGEEFDTLGSRLDSTELQLNSVEEEVQELHDGLKQFIDAEAVDGLIYENNMLQLSASGIPVGNAVEIVAGTGGGGGGSGTTVRLVNLNGSSSLSASKNSPVILKFKFTSVEDDIPTGDGTCSVAVDGKVVVTYNIKQGENELDVSPYLQAGTNIVKLTCMDQYGGNRSLTYTVTVIELSMSSTFDASLTYSGKIPFRYTPVGIVSKTIHFLIDGVEVDTATVTSSNKQQLYNIPALDHGVHRLDAYATAIVGDSTAESNHLIYDVLAVEEGEDAAMIASIYTTTSAEQGDQISIPYIVYDPSKLTAEVKRTITYLNEGKEVVYHSDYVEVDRSQQKWTTRSYPTGTVTFTLSYDYNWNESLGKYLGHVEKSHTLTIEATKIDIQPVTTGSVLCLQSKDRSNNESDPAIWKDGDITTTFTNLNWKSNGWIEDESGDTCLRLSGDARATINYELFGKDFKTTGKTIEFDFLVRGVNNRDAVVIECLSGGIGLQVTADTASFNSQNTHVKCNYKDETRTRVSFVIEESSSLTNRLVYVYLDGILSGVQQYPTTDNFEQLEPVKITLGSSYCGLDLYTVRVYDMALTSMQMVDNYIADMPNMTEKIERYNANDIYDEFSRLSYERIKTRLPVVTLIGDLPKYKGDKKSNSVTFKFEDPFHPELNFTDICSSIDVQGTSSQFYPRKNWKIKFKQNHQHIPGELPAKVFCLKVDYAESTGTHNTQAANFIEKLYSEKTPPQLIEPKCRSTIEGFPIAIFEQATEDSEPVFSSKANFNYDKGASNVYGLTSDFDTESWEFCNNTSASCNFQDVIDSSAKWVDDFEPRYVPSFTCADGTVLDEPFDELDELEDKNSDINVNMTDEEVARMQELRKGLIARFKEVHDWVVSTKNDKDKFRKEFQDHFNLHFSLIYYIFTFFALMVDQRAKNMFLTYWNPTGEEGGGRWYPYFYDNDTIFGINNEGSLTFDYYHEDIDKVGDAYVYNGQNSTLWVNFRECFSSEIQSMYKTLRENGKLTYDKLMDQFVTQGSDMWCENIYNEDADYKYISIIHEPDNTGKLWSTSQLYQVRGSGKQHLDYFVQNRIDYCDSKWHVGDYASNMINVRIYTPILGEGQTLAVPANPNITVTPFSNMYAGVRYKLNGTILKKRLAKNESYTFEPPLQANGEPEVFNDTETVVYGADQISSLGDLSGLYCGALDVSAATKLVELIVGNHTEGYKNDNFRQIALGTNRLLKKLDLTNCSGLGVAGGSESQKALSLLGCPNIEEIEAFGTNITTIELPESGYIRKLHLPGTINNLTIKNQLYVEDLQVEDYTNIKNLCIDNCPTVDSTSILQQCRDESNNYTVERVRLTGLDWSFENLDFLRTLYSLRGIDENNQNTDNAYLVGTCHISKLTGAEMLELNEHFPYLDITFDSLVSELKFFSAVGKEYTTARQTIYNGGDGLEPVSNRLLLEAPVKTSSAQWDYTWSGWSRKNGEDEEPQEDAVLNILADRTLYPTFTKSLRSYPVRFWNSGDAEPICTLTIPYGSDATYPEDVYGVPEKNTASSEAFAFSGWAPSPEYITGPTDCYAQYTIKDGEWHNCTIQEFDYTKNESRSTLDITGWKGTETVIQIPTQFELDGTYTVDSVGGFKNSDIVAVKLPEQLSTLPDSAFLRSTQLESIEIPESVETITEAAFKECTSLATVDYNAVNAAVKAASGGNYGAMDINNSPFEKAGGEKGLVVTVGNSVKRIPERLFYQVSSSSAGVTDLSFEEDSSCETIGYGAFRNSSIKELTLPSSLRSIGDYAFWTNRVAEELTLPEGVQSIGGHCFRDWLTVKRIHLPSTLVSVSDYAFGSCPKLEEFTIADGSRNFNVTGQCLIRTRDMRLIAGNQNSEIPEGVQSIGDGAFDGAEGLESIVVPEGVTAIPQYTFQNCTKLKSVTLPQTVTSIGANGIYNCAVESLDLPENLTLIETYALAYNDNLKTLVIPDSVTTIKQNAFSYCPSLEEVTIGSGVQTLGINLFAGCTNLKTINIALSEDQTPAGAPWGAPEGVTINYNYVRTDK